MGFMFKNKINPWAKSFSKIRKRPIFAHNAMACVVLNPGAIIIWLIFDYLLVIAMIKMEIRKEFFSCDKQISIIFHNAQHLCKMFVRMGAVPIMLHKQAFFVRWKSIFRSIRHKTQRIGQISQQSRIYYTFPCSFQIEQGRIFIASLRTS